MAEDAIDLQSLLRSWEDEAAIEEQLRALGDDGAAGDDRRLLGEPALPRPHEPHEPHEWVSLAEAEHRAGVSRSTLRAWYRSGQLPSRLMPGPYGMHRLVPLGAVLERVARSPRPAGRSSESIGQPAATAAAITGAAAATAAGAEAAEQDGTPPMHGATGDVVRLAEIAVREARDRAAAAERRAEAAEQALRDAIERAAAAEAVLRVLRER